MTIDQALAGMARASELYDGSEESATLADALQCVLIQTPTAFWGIYLEVLEALRDDPMRDLALRLIAEGRFTWAHARAALEQYNASAAPPPPAPAQVEQK